MPIKKGTHLGGVDSVQALRLRCYCPAHTDCWHLRSAVGKPMPKDRAHRLHVFGHGQVTIGRAIWILTKGATKMPRGLVLYRTCGTYDCANPEHFKLGRRASVVGLLAGRPLSAARRAALEVTHKRQTKLAPEIREWIAESRQSGSQIAHAVGVSRERVNAIKREMAKRPCASVFDLAERVRLMAMRLAA